MSFEHQPPKTVIFSEKEEKRFLDAIKKIFQDSTLLKGKVPPDEITLQQLNPKLVEELKQAYKADPANIDNLKKMVVSEYSGKGKGKP